jgi:hypothetical protein
MDLNMAKKSFITLFGRQLKFWFMKDTKVKVGIFLLTMIIWFFTILSNQYTYTIDTTLDILNIEQGKTLKEKLPKKIKVDFSGRGFDLFYLLISQKSSFKFVLDVENIHWFYDFNLNEYFLNNPEKIIIPRNVDVKFDHVVYPESLRVELDRLDVLKVPVRPRLNIKTAPGYTLVNDPVLEPDSITLSGPRTYLKKYKEINTEEYTVSDVKSPVEINLNLEISATDNINIPIKRIHLFQAVDQIGERIITNIPIKLTGVPRGTNVELSPSEVTLTVASAVSHLKDIKPEDIDVYFNFQKNWKRGENYYVPTVELPAGIISWSNLTPRRIEVRILRERSL